MYQLTKLNIGSVALYSFLMLLILSLILISPLGLMFTFLSSIFPDTGEIESEMFPFLGGLFIIILPIFYAVFGTIINVLIAVLYNLLSRKLGGLKFNIKKIGVINRLIE